MLEKYIRSFFARHGRFVAEHPMGVFLIALVFVTVATVGVTRVTIVENPVQLWVEPDTKTAKDLDVFNNKFRPFFRVEEVILSNEENMVTNAAVLESMEFHLKLQSTPDPETGATLRDLCWNPLAPSNKDCLFQSWVNYFRDDMDHLRQRINFSDPYSAQKQVYPCTFEFAKPECHSSLALPTLPEVIWGTQDSDSHTKMFRSKATLMTYLLKNSEDPEWVEVVRSWEKNVFVKLAGEWAKNNSMGNVTVNYMAQRSVEDALIAEESNHISIVISYLIMFAYITIALGYFSKVHSKMWAALMGIMIVLVSIMSSVGFCSTIGVPLTLIIVDVIPFLLVAIGVDNMFIISNEFFFRCRVQQRRLPRGARLTDRQISAAMSEALGEVGGTIFLAGSSEGLAFSLGALTSMPAVQAFCLYSGVAILVNLALQLTVYVAFLTFDARRASSGRFDVAPCLRHGLDPASVMEHNPMAEEGTDDPDHSLISSPTLPITQSLIQGSANPEEETGNRFEQANPRNTRGSTLETLRRDNSVESVSEMQRHKERVRDDGLHSFAKLVRLFLRKIYVPKLLFKRPFQIFIVLAFIIEAFCVLFFVSPHMTLGLKPSDSIPDNFYLRDTLIAIEDYLKVGPLIYFATPAAGNPIVNYTHPDVIAAHDYLAHTLKDTAYIEKATVQSWFHDFRQFLCEDADPPSAGCFNATQVGYNKNNYLHHFACSTETQMATRIPQEIFIPALKQFIHAPQCCFSGQSNTGTCGFQYDEDVVIGKAMKDANGNMWALSDLTQYDEDSEGVFEYVTASRVRAQTVRLSTSADYIGSLASAYNVTDTLNEEPLYQVAGYSMFPYSIYFVFYSQYLNLPSAAAQQISMAIGAVILVTFLILSSLSSTLSVTLCIVLILINLTGLMAAWEIEINAISVVNMVMCVGISVEFCAHIAVSFCGTKGPIRRRMMASMVDMGANVVCGITLTKLLGVSVLAFNPGRVFRKYYFKMYASMVMLGALHGLLFLPCLLLLIGATLRQRRYKFASL